MSREFPERPVAAVGAIVFREGKVLLVRRGVEPSAGLWSIPGGAVELGETLHEALVREVKEETGLEVKPTRLVDVYNTIVEREGRIQYHYVIIDYLCEYVSGDLQASSDVEEVRWVDPSSLGDYRTTSTTPLAVRKALELGATE